MEIKSKNLQNPSPENLRVPFYDSFESFTENVKWKLNKDSTDFITLDGNAASASYLLISKDPFTQGSVTTLETVSSFKIPSEFIVGFSMSQRVLGQELAIELVDDEDNTLPLQADDPIASISQSGTTLTVTTSSPHGLVAGKRIGIRGISDSRLNYPSLVVGGINNPTQFVCTAGPMGTIPSLTVGPYTNQGFVYFRPAHNYAKDAASIIYENATSTNCSFYVRADSGDSLPTGTASTNHSINCQSTNGIQAITYAYNYAWLPGNEVRLSLFEDKLILHDASPDSSSNTSIRTYRTQVLPNPYKNYKLRIRFTNNKSLTVPTAKIVSAVKSASATATITTADAHGLTTGDYVIIYGIRDSVNFAQQTTPVQVLSTPTTTSFTVTFGATTTATSYGGMVARANGNNVPGSFNTANQNSIQTVSVSNGEITLIAAGNFTVAIGDYVNLYGCRNNTNGADLGLDGFYKVSEASTTTARLIPAGTTPTPSNLTSTSCGGSVIKRTDFRFSYCRVLDFDRLKVEHSHLPTAAAAIPNFSTGGSLSTVSTVTTVSSVTAVAASNTNFNQIVTDIASGAITSSTTSASITPAASALSQEFNVIVTAVSGTTPTLDLVIQESDDSGTNWYDIYHFPRITATGQYRTPLIPLTGNRVRYARTVGGTSPSFTMSLNRQQSNTSNPLHRHFITYAGALAVNTLNSVSPSYFTEGCVDLNVFVCMGAVTTTAPVLVYEASPDNVNWVQVGADITTAANTNNILQISNVQARFSRIRVKTAGSGATLNFVTIKGIGN